MDMLDLATLIAARALDLPETAGRQFPTGGDYMIDTNLADHPALRHEFGNRVGGALRALED